LNKFLVLPSELETKTDMLLRKQPARTPDGWTTLEIITT